MEHVAQVCVVHTTRDLHDPTRDLVDVFVARVADAAVPSTTSPLSGSCSPTSSITMYGWPSP